MILEKDADMNDGEILYFSLIDLTNGGVRINDLKMYTGAKKVEKISDETIIEGVDQRDFLNLQLSLKRIFCYINEIETRSKVGMYYFKEPKFASAWIAKFNPIKCKFFAISKGDFNQVSKLSISTNLKLADLMSAKSNCNEARKNLVNGYSKIINNSENDRLDLNLLGGDLDLISARMQSAIDKQFSVFENMFNAGWP